jgi:starch phosphorylase
MKKRVSNPGSDYEGLLAVLKGLAHDLRWSWNHSAHRLWRTLDPELWQRTRNPVLLLQTISRENLIHVAGTREFRDCLRDVLLQSSDGNQPQPFVKGHLAEKVSPIAYFSMEYMLSEALPIYSGGLGNVAGDQLKAAADLNIPVVAVGLLFQQGYFRQEIDSHGEQQAFFPFNDPNELPVTPVRTEDGEWARVKIIRPNFAVWLRAWQAKVGSAILYLLDTNDPANDPIVRLIGSELYGGGPQVRLRQEMILGLGGWRLLNQLGIEPKVCHLNEGHAAFAILERARCFMEDTSCDFPTALAATRAGNLFTTHTPVTAGFDRFSPQLMESHLRFYAEEHLRLPFEEFLALGRRNPNDKGEPFNMAYLAIRGSGSVNGVSRLHGKISRKIFQDLFPRWPEAEVPVGHVTNGVHAPTWASKEASALWNEAVGSPQNDVTPVSLSGHFRPDVLAGISNRQLWYLRSVQRLQLIEYTRMRLAAQRAAVGISERDGWDIDSVLNTGVLTLAFARRFAEYKRPTLLLHNPERLVSILTDASCPAQLIIAGKAHPDDSDGQSMIKQWNDFVREHRLWDKVVFLGDYDMHLTQKLVQGADVWINTPRRPWEASGTSGMKVLVNGGLNLSVLDGWWAEAYAPEFGWAVGNTTGASDDEQDAEQLYTILEREVKPAFYKRDADGIPQMWIAKMRASMSQLTPNFSAYRAVREYFEQSYTPAALAYASRAKKGARLATEIVAWQRRVEQCWHQVRMISRQMSREDRAGGHSVYKINASIELGDLFPSDVMVEIFADNENSIPRRQVLELQSTVPDSNTAYVYSGEVPADRPESHYSVRVIPYHPEVQVPLELPRIYWEK